jgi:Tfp pilus assembly protein FimT
MKTILKGWVLAGLLASICLAGEPQQSPTRDMAISKARQCLDINARPLFDTKRYERFLSPQDHSNSVSVNDDLTEVRFHHSGRPSDSNSITFIVKMDKALGLVKIEILIEPGGHL